MSPCPECADTDARAAAAEARVAELSELLRWRSAQLQKEREFYSAIARATP